MDQTILVQEEPLNMWQLIEIPITVNGVQKVPLPDIQQLRSQAGRNIIIKGFKLVTDKILTNGMTVAGTTAPKAELQKQSLVVFSEGWQRGQLMPLLMLNPMADADAATATTIGYSNTPVKLADWKRVDFPQSFLQFANGTVSANAPYVVMLLCDYLIVDDSGQMIFKG